MDLELNIGGICRAMNWSAVHFEEMLAKRKGKPFGNNVVNEIAKSLCKNTNTIFGVKLNDIENFDTKNLHKKIKLVLDRPKPGKEHATAIVGKVKGTIARGSKRNGGVVTNDQSQELSNALERISQLEQVLQDFKPLLDLFKRVPNTGGGRPTPSQVMDRFVIRMEASGSSASEIHKFLSDLYDTFPVLGSQEVASIIDPTDNLTRKTPSVTYIERMRGAIPKLNSERLKSFVDDATKLSLSSDDSPSLDGSTNFLSMGLHNQMGDYCAVGIAPNSDKTAVGISRAMLGMLEQSGCFEQICEKLRNEGAIVTDRARSQVKANGLLLVQLKNRPETLGSQIPCYMHTVKNGELYACKPLSESTMDTIKAAEIVFGSRWYSGYHRASLKADLNALLGSHSGAYFKNEKGSRFGVKSNNSRALINHRDEVRQVVSGKSNKYAQALSVALADSKWTRFGLECGCLVMLFYGILSPFHSIVSATGPWKTVRSAILDCRTKLQALANTESKPFDVFASLVSTELAKSSTGQVSYLSDKTNKAWFKISDLYRNEASRFTLKNN